RRRGTRPTRRGPRRRRLRAHRQKPRRGARGGRRGARGGRRGARGRRGRGRRCGRIRWTPVSHVACPSPLSRVLLTRGGGHLTRAQTTSFGLAGFFVCRGRGFEAGVWC
ncbi:hypothetical protein T484DRAFT_1914823, partial [Baffinella frigidus]